MSVILYSRAEREQGPEMPSGELQLQEPPTLPETQGAAGGMISYLPMALSSMAMVLIFIRPDGSPITFVAIGMMAVSAVAMLVTQFLKAASDRKRALRSERRDYLRYLSQVRRQVRAEIENQQRAQAWVQPEPAELWPTVGGARMWERRPMDNDFGEVRIAIGEQRFAMRIAPLSTSPVEDLEPLCAHALRRFIRAYSSVADQPVPVFLPAYARVLLRGDDDAAVRALVRAMLTELAVLHAPTELRIALVVSADRAGQWDWAKWLPHVLHPNEADGAGMARLIVDTPGRLEALLSEELAARTPFEADARPDPDEPYTVIVLDTDTLPNNSRLADTGYRRATVLDIGAVTQWQSRPEVLRLEMTGQDISLVDTDRAGKDTPTALGRADGLSIARSLAVARRLAPYRLSAAAEATEPLTSDFELTTLLGITDLFTHDVDEAWSTRSAEDRLRVPLGVSADGSPVHLDIKESAQGGMGPHGMLIGATGSGKSELLRTMVLALALAHSSETLNFVLVDFKGGATFLGLDQLPHTSAVITNLADEAGLVDRMRDALNGEVVRRQELLRKAGNYSSALEYERARAAGVELAPLPTLFVIVDEFSELLAAHRDFMDLFIMIGRLGRSLGVHLLLASQRLDEGRMHQLESHLSYRIGLRTFSAMESRGVLGVPDAYQLPSAPGNGFLKSDVATLTRFKAAYVSGPYRSNRRVVEQSEVAREVTPYSAERVALRTPPTPEPVEEAAEESTASLLAVAVGRLAESGPPAHQVWLPPLDVPPTLAEVLPPLAVDAELGLTTADRSGRGGLAVPVGIVDRPFDQMREPMIADLSGAGGHIGIAGGPQSGKSTLLRSLIMSLALTHTPREVQFYCLDFGGGTLTALAGLPHVGSVAGRLDTERVNRTIGEVNSLIARRERDFAKHGIGSIGDFRKRRAAGEFAEDLHGDVFLVIDGWTTVKQELMDILPTFTQIAARGLSFGVHLMVASTRWGDINSALRDQLGTRFELRLGDPVDSLINMRAAATVPKLPGRGLTERELHFITALPRTDETADAADTADLSEGTAAAVEAIAAAWTGPKAAPVRMLPLELPAHTLPAPEDGLRMPLGVEEQELAPFWHDFTDTPHLMVVGDAETGKTNLLKLVANAITSHYGPNEAKVGLVDYRRELLGSVPEEYRLGYAVSTDVLRQAVDGVARAMNKRLPGPEVSPEQLRERSWWTGPELFVVVDDYDLVVGSNPMNNPFLPILDLLAQGVEIGLHLVIARSANGFARAGSDPLVRRLTEVNTPALLLSCPPSEGFLFGNVKPKQLPAGRAQHITRRRVTLIQTAMADEPAPAVTDALLPT